MFITTNLAEVKCHAVFMQCSFLLQTVQQRGAAVIKARKLSSAMSAAKAICDHMRDIWMGTAEVNTVFICNVEMSACFNNKGKTIPAGASFCDMMRWKWKNKVIASFTESPLSLI